MMMATSATNKTRPTKKDMVRLPAPVIGPVRKPCKVCDSSEEDEEHFEISTLKKDIAIIWQENQDLVTKLKSMHEDEKKIRDMNKQMDDFFTQIPLGKMVKDAGSQTEEIDEREDNKDSDEGIVKVKKEALLREKNLWKEKEVLLSQLLMFQKKSIKVNPKKQAQTQVKRKLWGHSTIAWRAPGHQICQDTPSGPKVFHKLKKSKPKPFVINFQPKPIKSFTNKFHVKPPPRLPPIYPSINMSTMAVPVACNNVIVDNVFAAPIEAAYDTSILREIFADALERAIASNDIDHCQEDCNNNELGVDIHNDNADHEEEQHSDVEEDVAWEDHPYYDDLGSPETDLGDEELDIPVCEEDDQQHEATTDVQEDEDTPAHEEDDQQEEAFTDDQEDEVVWEDHPYYDTPEEDSDAELEVSEEDVAWEDSPYY